MKNQLLLVIAAAVLVGILGFQWMAANKANAAEKTMDELNMTTTMSGLKWTDTEVGTGTAAEKRDLVSVHYTGTLYPSGKKFDSSLDRGEPFQFRLGAKQVIPGWDEGVAGMKVGGKRTLIIPPQLAYGKNGVPPVIPPDATLKFDIELLEVK